MDGDGPQGISLTHNFGLYHPQAMRASEKDPKQKRRVHSVHLSGTWPAGVDLSLPGPVGLQLGPYWLHKSYWQASFFLTNESNLTTQNGFGLLPQIQQMTGKAGLPVLKSCLRQKIPQEQSPSLKSPMSYSLKATRNINCLHHLSSPLSSPCLE